MISGNMRFCLPRNTARDAGLGNELFPWAKAFIASSELGLRLLHPAWGLNRRGYRSYFGTSRLDWLYYRALTRALPCFAFTEQEYLATGEKEFGRALRAFAGRVELDGKGAYVLLTEGMWGGFYSILKAKQFVVSTLYQTRNLLPNLYDLAKRIDTTKLVIAVHIRLGDFRPASETRGYRGVFNASIPLAWYMKTCRAIKEEFGRRVTFLLVTDGGRESLREFIEEFEPVTTSHLEANVCSDLLAMASADALICSVSSFSMWGAFLSSAPYIWYLPNLTSHGSFLSIWGHEPQQQEPDGVTQAHCRTVGEQLAGEETGAELNQRGVPVDVDGVIPDFFLRRLEDKLRQKMIATDLIAYGVVAAGATQR
jgi:hypothetical protein